MFIDLRLGACQRDGSHAFSFVRVRINLLDCSGVGERHGKAPGEFEDFTSLILHVHESQSAHQHLFIRRGLHGV